MEKPTDFIKIVEDEDRIISKMPAAESVVEVQMKDGSIQRAFYDANIMEAGDFDFIPLTTYGEPDIEANSIADDVTAWRPLT